MAVHRCRAQACGKEQLRLPALISCPACGDCHASNPAIEEGVDRAPRSGWHPPQETSRPSQISQRRLQEEYDVECAAVARLGMDRGFTHGRCCWDTTPSTGKQRPQASASSGFRPRYPQHIRRLRCRIPACRHRCHCRPSRKSLARRASTRRLLEQPHSCVGNPRQLDNISKTGLTLPRASPATCRRRRQLPPPAEPPAVGTADLRQPPSVAPSTTDATP
jgi:hypothetical protein